MDLYLLLVEKSGDAEEPSSTSYITYEHNASGAVLPVYTTTEALTDAMKACASSRDFDYIGFELTDPFDLADMTESLEAYGLKALVFDPPPAPHGKISVVGDPVPVGEYRSAVEEIRSRFEELGAEAEASVEGINADLHALIEEWVV